MVGQYLHADRGLSPGFQRPSAAASRSASTSGKPGMPATPTRSCSPRNFGGAERIRIPHQQGGHFGSDPALHRMLFAPDMADPLGQRAGARGRRPVGADRRRGRREHRAVAQPVNVKSLLSGAKP